jgi:undecaprenyl-diphosphatase
MDQILQALVMGIVQGLTEFLPISSSGHLILVPYLLGWDDPFIESLAFSVVLHGGTLLALLVYFREDWLRLIPAFFASLRDRSIGDDRERRLVWLLVLSTLPAAVIAFGLNDIVEQNVRQPGLVAVMLVIGGAILWIADRWGPRTHTIERLTARGALGIGLAQALALIPGVSRSGISMSAALFAGLDRADAARYSFLMATPITAMAVAWESLKLLRGEVGGAEPVTLIVGVVASFVSGILAIAVLLRYVRTRSFNIFVVYRLILAAIVLAVFLVPGRPV